MDTSTDIEAIIRETAQLAALESATCTGCTVSRAATMLPGAATASSAACISMMFPALWNRLQSKSTSAPGKSAATGMQPLNRSLC